MQKSEKIYLNWLYHIPGIGKKRIEQILLGTKNSEWLYYAGSEELKKYLKKVYQGTTIPEGCVISDAKKILQAQKGDSPKKMYEDLTRRKIQFLCRKDEDYPSRLQEIPDAPIVLYRMGAGKLQAGKQETGGFKKSPVVAVVGTRNCTEYGKAVAKRIGELCAEMDVGLVSGLASGIDGISQWSALKNGGKVAAVLGCGVDICYPWENKGIYTELLEKGEIYSEYIPGTQPRSQYFPPRNRIISGLSDAVIVVEAKEKSGTMITVDMALEQGRDVYVIPGRITDPMSAGCNRLIAQGAEMVVSLESVLQDIITKSGLHNITNISSAGSQQKPENSNLPSIHRECFDSLGQSILSALDFRSCNVQQLYETLTEAGTTLDIKLLQQKLVQLEIEGIVSESGGWYSKKNPCFNFF